MSETEFERFDQFVHAPFFSSHQDTIRFFELLAPHFPQLEADALEDEAVFAHLYPGQPYDNTKVRTLRKYLLELLRQFMVQLELEGDELTWQTLHRQALAARRLDKDFSSSIKRERKRLDAFPYRNAEYFLRLFQLENAALAYGYVQGNRWAHKDQQRVTDALDAFFLAEKLKFCCSVMNVRNVFGTDAEIPLLDEVMAHCRAQENGLPVIVEAYYRLLQLLAGQAPESTYPSLRQLANEHFDRFPTDDWLNIYYAMINHCNQQYRAGKAAYLREMLELYQEMLHRNLLLEDSYLGTNNYKNITTLGLRLGEWTWTRAFIHTYKAFIHPDYQEGVYNYNMAHWHAYQEEFPKALRHLQMIEFIDPFYRMSYNMLLMKIYYECEEAEALLALCESFRAFVRHKKELTKSHQQAYLNFIKFTRALFLLKIGLDKRTQALEQKVAACEVLIERDWIEEKLNQLRTAA